MAYSPTQEGAWIHVWHSISINVGRTDVVYIHVDVHVHVHGQKWSKKYSMYVGCMHLPFIILHIQYKYTIIHMQGFI